MARHSSSLTHYVDDLYFAALFDKEEIFPISDEDYAEELTLQEALFSSSSNHSVPLIDLTDNNITNNENRRKKSKKETGQSSSNICLICMERDQEMFRNNGCGHSFCSDCIGKHVAAKIQENIMMVRCPDVKCKGVIEPHHCRTIVPKQVLDRWEEALCESMILGVDRFYCPFKDCSAMMVDDSEGGIVTASECPHCRRMFCAQCKVVWHAGFECSEFQAMNKNRSEKEDKLLMKLADRKKWRRCPKCKIYVEKKDGCNHITCRCKHEFCYVCGAKYSDKHNCS